MTGYSEKKLEVLQHHLSQMKKVAVAFSGGMDSTFLIKIAYDVLGNDAIAITATSSIYPQNELDEAKTIAQKIGISHILMDFDPTTLQRFSENPVDRCYVCKKELFTQIKHIASDHDISFVLDGSNTDDMRDFRPGMKALDELGIISPLRDVRLTKKDIKHISKKLRLPTWDKPSFACLASRFPYGEHITKEKLWQVEQAEHVLSSLGCSQYRVRYNGDLARIEVLPTDFNLIIDHSQEIIDKFKKLGFTTITLDLQGYRTGSLNEGILHGKSA